MASGKGSTSPATPIPILLTVRELHHGGIEHDAAKIAIHLDRSRFEPHVASYQAEGIRFEELKHAGVPILHLPVSSLKSWSALSAAIRLRQYIRKHRIRLVHAYDPSVVFVAPIARALRVPTVLSSTLGDRSLLSHRTHQQLRWTDKIVDTIVVNCQAMRRHMIDDEHVPDGRIMLCHNGVNTNLFYPARGPLPSRAPFRASRARLQEIQHRFQLARRVRCELQVQQGAPDAIELGRQRIFRPSAESGGACVGPEKRLASRGRWIGPIPVTRRFTHSTC